MSLDEILDFPYDPWLILGVPHDVDDRGVKAAWKRAGAPESGILADAYEMLKDGSSRLQTLLLGPGPYSNAGDAAAAIKKRPVYLGPGAWYNEISKRRRS